MELEEVKLKLGELGIEPELYETIIKKMNMDSPKATHEIVNNKSQIFELESNLEREEDWRKKAAIAAKIISLGLE